MSQPITNPQPHRRAVSAGLTTGPVDADIDLHVPSQRWEWSRHRFVLPAIALGGMLGASVRYGAGLMWPTPPGSVPWATLGVNAAGCLLIGVLMVFVVEIGGAHPLLRPFVGVGILGGFTTFSTYAVDTISLLRAGHPSLAFGYWAGTLLAALVAVVAGVFLARVGARTRAGLRRRRRDDSPNTHDTDDSADSDGGRS